MNIAAVGSAFPPHYCDQASITAALRQIWRADTAVEQRLEALHRNVGVEGRYLALPIESYAQLDTFGQANDVWIRVALDVGERAVRTALDRAGLEPRDVDVIFFSTVTGLASPSIDARLAHRMGFRPDVKRLPLFGLGCVAGAAAVSRAADYLAGHEDAVALVLTIELCSLTFQLADRSIANLISTGLFGDGASAAVLVGAKHPRRSGPEVVATRSVLYPDSEDVMGWNISERGFRILLSAQVPTIAGERLPADVDAFLGDQGLQRKDIGAWVCHPGGPKVLEAMQTGLGLEREDLAVSWQMLQRCGNLSSASVLLILEETMRRGVAPGSAALMLAMGPGFCSELLLLRWS